MIQLKTSWAIGAVLGAAFMGAWFGANYSDALGSSAEIRYSIAVNADGSAAWRINSVTGEVSLCTITRNIEEVNCGEWNMGGDN